MSIEQKLLRINFLLGFVAHGMNYLTTLGSLTPCQSFARNCLIILIYDKFSANFFLIRIILFLSYCEFRFFSVVTSL